MALSYTNDDYTLGSNVSASVTIPAGALIIVGCLMFDGAGVSTAPGVPTATGLTFTEIGHIYAGSTFGVGIWKAVAPGGGFTGHITADALCFDIATEQFTGASGNIVQSTFNVALVNPANVELDNNYGSGAITSGNMGYSFWYCRAPSLTTSARSGWTKAWEHTDASNHTATAQTTTATDTAAGVNMNNAGSIPLIFGQIEVEAAAGGGGVTKLRAIYEPTYVRAGWFDPTLRMAGWFDRDFTDLFWIKVALAVQWESLGDPSSARACAWESLTDPSAARVTPWESLTDPRASKTTPWESLNDPRATGVTPLESLTDPSAARVTPYESLTDPRTSKATPWESLTNPHASGTVPWESISTVVHIVCSPTRPSLLDSGLRSGSLTDTGVRGGTLADPGNRAASLTDTGLRSATIICIS